jgi:hypothetical protein
VDTFDTDDEPFDDLLLDHVDTGPTVTELLAMAYPPPTIRLDLGDEWSL